MSYRVKQWFTEWRCAACGEHFVTKWRNDQTGHMHVCEIDVPHIAPKVGIARPIKHFSEYVTL